MAKISDLEKQREDLDRKIASLRKQRTEKQDKDIVRLVRGWHKSSFKGLTIENITGQLGAVLKEE